MTTATEPQHLHSVQLSQALPEGTCDVSCPAELDDDEYARAAINDDGTVTCPACGERIFSIQLER